MIDKEKWEELKLSEMYGMYADLHKKIERLEATINDVVEELREQEQERKAMAVKLDRVEDHVIDQLRADKDVAVKLLELQAMVKKVAA